MKAMQCLYFGLSRKGDVVIPAKLYKTQEELDRAIEDIKRQCGAARIKINSRDSSEFRVSRLKASIVQESRI